jgi:hypothetical protein
MGGDQQRALKSAEDNEQRCENSRHVLPDMVAISRAGQMARCQRQVAAFDKYVARMILFVSPIIAVD